MPVSFLLGDLVEVFERIGDHEVFGVSLIKRISLLVESLRDEATQI